MFRVSHDTVNRDGSMVLLGAADPHSSGPTVGLVRPLRSQLATNHWRLEIRGGALFWGGGGGSAANPINCHQ